MSSRMLLSMFLIRFFDSGLDPSDLQLFLKAGSAFSVIVPPSLLHVRCHQQARQDGCPEGGLCPHFCCCMFL